jgi:hypothetical protein
MISFQLAANQNHLDFFKTFNQWIIKDPLKLTFYIDGKPVALTPAPGKLLRPEDAFIGTGGCKKACLFGDDVCLVPNAYTAKISSDDWERIIQEEKSVSDAVAILGLKTQKFDIVTLSVQDNTGEIGTVRALRAKSFAELAHRENMTVIDYKGTEHGMPMQLYNNDKTKLNDFAWNKALFQTLLNEIVLALSYKVPCRGDSRNYYCQYSKVLQSAPTFHLFLFDFSDKEKAFNFPAVKTPPKIANQDEALQIFTLAIDSILCRAQEKEVEKLGFKEIRDFRNAQFAYLTSKPIMDSMIAEAYQQVPLMIKKIAQRPGFEHYDFDLVAEENARKRPRDEHASELLVEYALGEVDTQHVDIEKLRTSLIEYLEDERRIEPELNIPNELNRIKLISWAKGTARCLIEDEIKRKPVAPQEGGESQAKKQKI